MRHVGSVVLALVLGAIIYVAAGFAEVRFEEVGSPGVNGVRAALLGTVGAVGAGGLYAVLVLARLSPVGPALVGLLYLGLTGWRLADRDGFADIVPLDPGGAGAVLHTPVPMITALLAVPLLATVVSPRRWRRSAQPAASTDDNAPPDLAPAPPYGPLPTAAVRYQPSHAYGETGTSDPASSDPARRFDPARPYEPTRPHAAGSAEPAHTYPPEPPTRQVATPFLGDRPAPPLPPSPPAPLPPPDPQQGSDDDPDRTRTW